MIESQDQGKTGQGAQRTATRRRDGERRQQCIEAIGVHEHAPGRRR
jgi:hypothetical protein